MKTLFLLNRDDVRALTSGEPWELQIGGAMVIFQTEHGRKGGTGPREADDPDAPLVNNSARCSFCKRRKGQHHTKGCRYTTKSKTAKLKKNGG